MSNETKGRQEPVLRFMSVRGASPKERNKRKISLYIGEEWTSNLHEEISKVSDRDQIVAIAKVFKEEPGSDYVKRIEELPLDLSATLRWLSANSRKQLKETNLHNHISQQYGCDLQQLIRDTKFRKAHAALADTLVVDTIIRGPCERLNDDIVLGLKLFHFLEKARQDPSLLESEETLGRFIASIIVSVPRILQFSSARLDERESKKTKKEERPDKQATYKAKRNELEDAHKELSQLMFEKRTKQFLSPSAVKTLSASTRKVFDDLKIDTKKINLIETLMTIDREIGSVSAQLSSEMGPRKVIMLAGGVVMDEKKFKESMGYGKKAPELDSGPAPLKCEFEAGIGDLLIVRQALVAYELGDIAHVENILAGESKEREHRRLNLKEELTSLEMDRETEKERDMQSTERNELQNEAEKVVKDQFQLEAGLQISGSYGPAFSFSSSLNAAYDTSTEETQRKASVYANEVTEKTAERIRERVREERRRRIVEEVQEINRHKIDNSTTPKGHIRGIYRWLNKIYKAQVFNYGKRMMYEFTVPEPAAFFLYALVTNPPKNMVIEKPDPPTFEDNPLKPENLTRANYQEYISQYRVINIPELPPQFTVVAYQDKQDVTEKGSNYARSLKIEIPDGYAAIGALVSVQSRHTPAESGQWGFYLHVGGVQIDELDVEMEKGRMIIQRPTFFRFVSPIPNAMSVTMVFDNADLFAYSIDVLCVATPAKMTKWQHDMYTAIMEAYHQQKSDYDSKLTSAAIQKGVQILGRNPLENRRLEREELKKLIIMMLSGTTEISQSSITGGESAETEGEVSPPEMMISRACEQGGRIRFLENGFEWNNMVYVFYPYFWGRQAKWSSAFYMTDPDPDFGAFLKAGAARVQVPVRPGFERAVAHFCQFGEIWEGNDIPLSDDDQYVPIIDEITENLKKPDGEVPYSEPWEVIVPTSLVVVQNLEEVACIRDPLNGEGGNINLLNPE